MANKATGARAPGRRPDALIGKPGDLPSRRSSGNRGKFSVGGKAIASPFVATSVKGLAAHMVRHGASMSL